MTKSLAVFDDTKTPTDIVDEVSRFLEEVGQRRKLKLHDMANAQNEQTKH